MNQPQQKTEYDLMFSNRMVRRLPSTTRVILLQYYREADIVAVLEDVEKNGTLPEALGFRQALDEFECRGIIRIAELPQWLIIKKPWKK
jgi:hypothetical protein